MPLNKEKNKKRKEIEHGLLSDRCSKAKLKTLYKNDLELIHSISYLIMNNTNSVRAQEKKHKMHLEALKGKYNYTL